MASVVTNRIPAAPLVLPTSLAAPTPQAAVPVPVAPAVPPTPALPTPRLPATASSGITVRSRPYAVIGIADLRPGDIGFEYKRHFQRKDKEPGARRRKFKQQLISWGGRIQNFGRPSFRGSPHVLHSFVVTLPEPNHGQLMIADAAAGGDIDPRTNIMGPIGVNECAMGFDPHNKFTDLHSHTLFLRFKDPRVGPMLVRLARAWCRPNVDTFTEWHALTAPWHRKHIHSATRRRLSHVVESLNGALPPQMKVMCSEFVSWVGAATAVSLYCIDRGIDPAKLTAPQFQEALGGLQQGALGNVFDCDPRAMVPAALHARMQQAPQVEVVGYIPAPLGDIP